MTRRARAGLRARHGADDGRRAARATSARPTRRRRRRVRRYLAQFLSDPRVVEIPRLLWWLILHGVDPAHPAGALGAQVREHLDAAKARRSRSGPSKQALLLARLPRRARPSRSSCARRCATASRRSPPRSTRSAPRAPTRILVLPLYPQYSAATTASVGRRRRAPGCAHAPQRARAALRQRTTTTTRATSTRWPRRCSEHWQRARPRPTSW